MIGRVVFALMALASLAPAQTTLPSIDAQVELLNKQGEPTEPADLKIWRGIPESRNAARILESVYTQLSAPERLNWDRAIVSHNQLISEYRLPLTAEDRDAIRESMNGNAASLDELDGMVECHGFDWGDPVIWTAGQNWRDDGGKERARGMSRYRFSESVDELVHLQLPTTQPAH